MPLNWNELKLASLPKFYALEFEAWKGRLKRDPWTELLKTKQSISAEMRKSA
jgi:DNA primase